MTGDEIREAFLRFYESKGHLRIPSSSLIPAGDPTLLLTNAGMVQFKPYFTGEMTPPRRDDGELQRRLTTAQKCFRTTDIDSVGDSTHLTFFEMLGNFSVGDYFKKEAIAYAWEFVTEHLKLEPERLWTTVFKDDDEAFGYWTAIGMPAERIRRCSEKDNFWGPAGSEGPCGPCSEIHYDFGEEYGCRQPDCGPNCENPVLSEVEGIVADIGRKPALSAAERCDRFVELWNLVFMQFYQAQDGSRTSLPAPNIDTGMGLERCAVILQGRRSIYETDLFQPIVQRVAELCGKEYGEDPEADYAMRVVAEHARSAAFLISDGVVPGNDGRGYVLRRVIRRAIRYGKKLGLEATESPARGELPFSAHGEPVEPYERNQEPAHALRQAQGERGEETARGEPVEPRAESRPSTSSGQAVLPQVAEVAVERMKAQYPDLAERREFILRVMALEEERFGETFERGSAILTGMLRYRKRHGGAISEVIAFAKSRNLGGENASGVLEQYGFVGYDPDAPAEERDGEEIAAQAVSQLAYEALSKLEVGKQQAADEAFRLLARWGQCVSGQEEFYLYDTYGFPPELTQEIAREHGLEVDMEGFQREMEAQRERARAASGKFGGDFDAVRVYQDLGVGQTKFLGYETLTATSVVVGLLVDGAQVSQATEGQQVEVVLRETPFYAEMGGQMGDAGEIVGTTHELSLRVDDTQTPIAGLTVHRCTVVRGSISLGDTVEARVDARRRQDIARNHTATHMLHAALRQVLGTHVRQHGSLVTPDRLRFDFTHVSPLSPQELREVQRLTNEKIRENIPVHSQETTYRQAVSQGALAFFGDRYGDRVRVVEVGQGSVRGEPVYPERSRREPYERSESPAHVLRQAQDERAVETVRGEPVEPRAETDPSTNWDRTDSPQPFSLEVCGGTHVHRTGDIGLCHVVSESSVGSGLRRIEAVTGRAAEELLAAHSATLDELSRRLQAPPDQLASRVDSLVAEMEKTTRQAETLERELLKRQVAELPRKQVEGINVVSGELKVSSAELLREAGDWLKNDVKSGVVALGAILESRPSMLIMATKDVVDQGFHAGNAVKEAAKAMGGGGGGRPNMAQAGGRDAGKLKDALRAAEEEVRRWRRNA